MKGQDDTFSIAQEIEDQTLQVCFNEKTTSNVLTLLKCKAKVYIVSLVLELLLP